MANALGSSQRASDDDLQVDVEGAGLPGPGQRSLELAEHLRLADHQGVEAAGDEKQMSHRIVAREPIGEAPPGLERQLVRPQAKRFEQSIGRVVRRGDRVKLGPVAGREKDAAVDQIMVDKTTNALANPGFGNESLFPDVEWG